VLLWDKGDERSIYTLQLPISSMKISTKLKEIMLYNVPTFFEEKSIETIWTRGLVSLHILDNIRNFLHTKRLNKGRQVINRR
jgi:hypothetical protein